MFRFPQSINASGSSLGIGSDSPAFLRLPDGSRGAGGVFCSLRSTSSRFSSFSPIKTPCGMRPVFWGLRLRYLAIFEAGRDCRTVRFGPYRRSVWRATGAQRFPGRGSGISPHKGARRGGRLKLPRRRRLSLRSLCHPRCSEPGGLPGGPSPLGAMGRRPLSSPLAC